MEELSIYLDYIENDTIGETQIWDSYLFLEDSNLEQNLIPSYSDRLTIDEWQNSFSEDYSVWYDNWDISGISDGIEVVGTEFDYKWEFNSGESENLTFFVSAFEYIAEHNRENNLDIYTTNRQIDIEQLIDNLTEIFAPDAHDGFAEALEKALSENGEELIFRDGYGRELTEEEIQQIEGIEIKTKNKP